MNIQKAAKWFGGVILVIGILGFIPGIVTPEGLFLGLFVTNTIHSLVYIITGMVAIFSGDSVVTAKKFFKIIGVIYIVITLFGIWQGMNFVFFPTNTPDTILHIIIAAYALYYGFRGEAPVM